MLIFIAFVLGCALGWMRATRRGGKLADKVQYALAHGIPAALLATAGVILAANMGWIG